ncbi:MAG: hemolysin family protein [Fimbriimonadaceae bacterium]|nr:HlyC/CorC family transporter [Chthonomonadaceae bacterium]MCO5297730.1 hemolysin family protein [Fimbriimonadaceae bacterium]
MLTIAVLAALVHESGNGLENAMASFGPLPAATAYLALTSVVAFTALNAMFILSETALEVLRPVHLKHVKEQSPSRAEHLQELMEERRKFVAATNIGSHLCRVGLVMIAFVLSPGLAARFGWNLSGSGPEAGSAYLALIGATLVLLVPIGLFNLILGELVPRSFALVHPHRIALALRRFMRGAAVVFALPAALVTMVANLVTNRFGAQASFAIANQAEEEIKTLVESAQESGAIQVDEKEMLHSVFEFTDTVAREVMTPRVDLDAVSIQSEPDEVVRVIRESGHSRIPIYEDTDDQILGIVHAKDLLMAREQSKNPDLRTLMRPALFVPENKNLHELLAEMRASRSQMAIVQDEFGGTAGIVTIEDIVEELVGDIVDEYDVEEEEIVELPNGFLVHGKAPIDDVNDALGSEFESDVFDTFGGYVFGLFGRQPRDGEEIEADGYRITIEETDGRRIRRLRIETLPEREAVHASDEAE